MKINGNREDKESTFDDNAIPTPRRTIRNVKVGDTIKARNVRYAEGGSTVKVAHHDDTFTEYLVLEVYPYMVRGYHLGEYRCFSLGDLVLAGKEPSRPTGFTLEELQGNVNA